MSPGETSTTSPDPSGPAAPTQLPTGVRGSGIENFPVLSPLLPVDLRPHFRRVYAYCRFIDDLADEQGVDANAREIALALLAAARKELHAGAADTSAHPLFRELGVTIREKDLPLQPFEDLIAAFEQDQRVDRYETWEQLLDYCQRSANPVGRIVLMLDGIGRGDLDHEAVRLSDLICTGLQLANHWQDVRRDLIERDRVYLPRVVCGVDAAFLRDAISTPDDSAVRLRYIRALRPLVGRTRAMFDEADSLADRLGPRLGPVVWLFHAAGLRVLDAIEAGGCTTLWERPRVSSVDKAMMIARVWCAKASGRFARSRSDGARASA